MGFFITFYFFIPWFYGVYLFTNVFKSSTRGKDEKWTHDFNWETWGKRQIRRPRHGWEDSIKATMKKSRVWGGWTDLCGLRKGPEALFCAGDGPSGLLKCREFFCESDSAAQNRVTWFESEHALKCCHHWKIQHIPHTSSLKKQGNCIFFYTICFITVAMGQNGQSIHLRRKILVEKHNFWHIQTLFAEL